MWGLCPHTPGPSAAGAFLISIVHSPELWFAATLLSSNEPPSFAGTWPEARRPFGPRSSAPLGPWLVAFGDWAPGPSSAGAFPLAKPELPSFARTGLRPEWPSATRCALRYGLPSPSLSGAELPLLRSGPTLRVGV